MGRIRTSSSWPRRRWRSSETAPRSRGSRRRSSRRPTASWCSLSTTRPGTCRTSIRRSTRPSWTSTSRARSFPASRSRSWRGSRLPWIARRPTCSSAARRVCCSFRPAVPRRTPARAEARPLLVRGTVVFSDGDPAAVSGTLLPALDAPFTRVARRLRVEIHRRGDVAGVGYTDSFGRFAIAVDLPDDTPISVVLEARNAFARVWADTDCVNESIQLHFRGFTTGSAGAVDAGTLAAPVDYQTIRVGECLYRTYHARVTFSAVLNINEVVQAAWDEMDRNRHPAEDDRVDQVYVEYCDDARSRIRRRRERAADSIRCHRHGGPRLRSWRRAARARRRVPHAGAHGVRGQRHHRGGRRGRAGLRARRHRIAGRRHGVAPERRGSAGRSEWIRRRHPHGGHGVVDLPARRVARRQRGARRCGEQARGSAGTTAREPCRRQRWQRSRA